MSNLKSEILNLIKFKISHLKCEMSNLKFKIANFKSEISNFSFAVMAYCWAMSADDRPSLSQLHAYLHDFYAHLNRYV